jgi:BirA family biotin operon repressor/biotin-[acetyl-CoA-carboxylase] ligase
LLSAAEAGAPLGSVYVAREQTAGRGRRGRAWIADPGKALAFSLLWAFPMAPAALNGLSLAVGVAIMRALANPLLGAHKTGTQIGLKWPNDILLRQAHGIDSKLGGILIESTVREDAFGVRETAVVIGIGLNCLASDALQSIVADQPVASLNDAYVSFDALGPDQLLPVLLDSLVDTLALFAENGFTALRDEWQATNLWHNEPVRVSESGRMLLDGLMHGVDVDGALCIATPSGIERVITGDVSLRKV